MATSQMNSAERFVALLAGFVTIILGIIGMIAMLVKISYQVGQLVQQFADHVEQDTRIQGDHEVRIRGIEQKGRR